MAMCLHQRPCSCRKLLAISKNAKTCYSFQQIVRGIVKNGSFGRFLQTDAIPYICPELEKSSFSVHLIPRSAMHKKKNSVIFSVLLMASPYKWSPTSALGERPCIPHLTNNWSFLIEREEKPIQHYLLLISHYANQILYHTLQFIVLGGFSAASDTKCSSGMRKTTKAFFTFVSMLVMMTVGFTY